MARTVCKGDFTRRVGLHQRIRSPGCLGKMRQRGAAPWISWVLRYLLPKSGLRVAQAP
jgi:hypothetical protein